MIPDNRRLSGLVPDLELHTQADPDLVATLVDLAKAGDKDTFCAIASMRGVPAHELGPMWHGTVARLRPAPRATIHGAPAYTIGCPDAPRGWMNVLAFSRTGPGMLTVLSNLPSEWRIPVLEDSVFPRSPTMDFLHRYRAFRLEWWCHGYVTYQALHAAPNPTRLLELTGGEWRSWARFSDSLTNRAVSIIMPVYVERP